MKEKTVCFSGHRPEKLPGNGNANDMRTKMIKSILYYKIHESVQMGYKFFISGLARGIDLWAAMYVLELKNQYPELSLICVKPTKTHGNSFSGKDRYMLQFALDHASEIICTSQSYHHDCYKLRNQYMVDHSSMLIAVLNNYASGTGQTINYARKKNIDIKIINTNDISNAYKAYYSTD